MKMRDLEAASGVGRETIRYYIGLGLLPEPVRPKPNVAVYDQEHVRRLGVIKRLQRERYLPLSFIKSLLDRPSGGEVSTIPGIEAFLAGGLGAGPDAPPVPLGEAAALCGLPVAELEALAREGVLFVDDGALRPLDLAVARAWGAVRAAGFTPETGFYVEDAAIYARALAPVAVVEIERFFTRVPGGLPPEAARDLAQAGIERVNGLLGAMRANYLLRALAALA